MKVLLSFGLTDSPYNKAILDGTVVPQGTETVTTSLQPSEMFWRQLRFGDFDVSEMSLASLAILISSGRSDWVALPVFTVRGFFHTGILVRSDSVIRSPADLAGRRVTVSEYHQTAAVWIRGALEHEFGVQAQQMTWFVERPVHRSHAGALKFSPPVGVSVKPLDRYPDGHSALADSAVDAVFWSAPTQSLITPARSGRGAGSTDVRRLFENSRSEGLRYREATGLLPMNHCVVVRASLAERHPWLLLNIYTAFTESRAAALRELRRRIADFATLGLCDEQTFAEDFAPYGVQAQEPTLSTLMEYLHEQGITPTCLAVDDFFPAVVRDL
jgi:4,5-dihydroxyphthalate decarboxylase